MNTKRVEDYFVRATAIALFMFAVVVLWSAWKGTERVFDRPDPLLLYLSHRKVFYVASAVALGLSALLFLARDRWTKLALTGWLSSSFLAYRIGLRWTGETDLFCYLGNMNALPLSPGALDVLLYLFSGGMFVGSFGLLIFQWLKNRKSQPKSDDSKLPQGVAAVLPAKLGTENAKGKAEAL